MHHKGKYMHFEDFLDALGDEGWELVTACKDTELQTRLFFKRPKSK
jgi:hypothetical protein